MSGTFLEKKSQYNKRYTRSLPTLWTAAVYKLANQPLQPLERYLDLSEKWTNS